MKLLISPRVVCLATIFQLNMLYIDLVLFYFLSNPSVTYSFSHSCIHSIYLFIDSVIHSFIDSFIHSFIHSFMPDNLVRMFCEGCHHFVNNCILGKGIFCSPTFDMPHHILQIWASLSILELRIKEARYF